MSPTPNPNIKHIVVLMMENRSFDHMLGYLMTENITSTVLPITSTPTSTPMASRIVPFPAPPIRAS